MEYHDIYRQRADLRTKIRKVRKDLLQLKKQEQELTETLKKKLLLSLNQVTIPGKF